MTDAIGIQPPNDQAAEAACLGSILGGGAAAARVLEQAMELLAPAKFYAGRHAMIFGAMLALREKGQPIDPATVVSWLNAQGRLAQVGGGEYVASLIRAPYEVRNVSSYVARIADTARLRAFIDRLRELERRAYGPVEDVEAFLAHAETEVREVTQTGQARAGELMQDAVKRVLSDLAQAAKTPGLLLGVPTGFEGLDRRMSGLRKKTVSVIAARPGAGKSAFALNMALNIARATGDYVPFFSVEMNNDEQATRAISTEASVPMSALMSADSLGPYWPHVMGYPPQIKGVPLVLYDDPHMTVHAIGARIRRLQTEAARVGKKVAAAFVDYLQLVKATKKHGSREAEVSEVSRGFKLLSKELDLPLVVLAQLNREGEKGSSDKPRRPKLSDLRESGAIEQDADVVIFIHQADAYSPGHKPTSNDVAELIVAKGRNIQRGIVKVNFDGRYVRFGRGELDRDDTRAEYDEPDRRSGP